jgi:hypothetical protein
VLTFEKGKMRSVETAPGNYSRMMEGMNSTMRGKNFVKCHSVPPVQQ